jgi:hypothetical protein
VGHDGQRVEALCVMMSIIGQMIADNSEADTYTDTHEDEHGGLPDSDQSDTGATNGDWK